MSKRLEQNKDYYSIDKPKGNVEKNLNVSNF